MSSKVTRLIVNQNMYECMIDFLNSIKYSKYHKTFNIQKFCEPFSASRPMIHTLQEVHCKMNPEPQK